MTADAPIANDRRATIGFWLLVGVIVAVGVGKAVRSDVLDPDCFWHIRVAEQLLSEGIHPIVDHLSYSSIKEPWTPYSWLAELGMKWLWDAGGYQLALLARAMIVAATIVLVALACEELAGRTRRLCSVVGVVFFAYSSLPYLSFRPATAATMLLALCAWLILRDRRLGERSRAVWLVIPITAICINLHLTAIVIPMWTAALLAGAMFEKQNIRRCAILFGGTALACLATPLLPGVIQAAWHYQSQDVMVASQLITEMQPIWRGGMGIVSLIILTLFALSALRGRKALRAGEWLMLLIGFILMLRLGRFAPIFAIIAGPVLAATMPKLSDKPLAKMPIQIVVAIALASFLWRVAESFPSRSMPFDEWLSRPHLQFHYPTAAASWVDANLQPRSGRLINEFNWGGYLAWRLGPKYQTLLDGRTQMFTADFWRSTLLAPDDATRARFLAAQNADVAIIPAGKSAFRAALEEMGWQYVHRDTIADVLLPPRAVGSPN